MVTTNILFSLLLAVAIIVLFYGYLLPLVRIYGANPTALYLQSRFELFARRDLSSVEEALSLAFSVLLQVPTVLVVGMCLSTPNLFPLRFTFEGCVQGALLGVSEFASASFLGFVVMRVLMALSPSSPRQDNYWIVLMNSGWMRLFNSGKELFGRFFTILLVIVFVTMEELLFRQFIFYAISPLGDQLAIFGSLTLFVGYQFFNMPAKRSALFPASGAFVVGLCNGYVMATTGSLDIAVTAHITVFTIVAFTY